MGMLPDFSAIRAGNKAQRKARSKYRAQVKASGKKVLTGAPLKPGAKSLAHPVSKPVKRSLAHPVSKPASKVSSPMASNYDVNKMLNSAKQARRTTSAPQSNYYA